MKEGVQFIPLDQIGTSDEPVKIPGSGVILGKFYPPHNGHLHLINTGLAESHALAVVVVERSEEMYPGKDRVRLLQELYPSAHIRLLNADGEPNEDSQRWAKLTIGKLHYIPEVAFNSEPYGKSWSEYMGSKDRQVDPDRSFIPISGTRVREDFESVREHVPEIVYQYLKDNVKEEYAK